MKPFPITTTVLALLAATAAAQTTIRVPDDLPTIAGAIAASNHGDTILVAPGTYMESNLRPRGKRITIRGTGGAGATIIDSEYHDRCFRITDPVTSDLVIEGFTFYRGTAPTGGGTIGDGGGGVLIGNGNPTIRNCSFQYCTADEGTTNPGGLYAYRGGHGGALYVYNGSPSIESCEFLGNRAGNGGDGARGSPGSDGTLLSAPTNGGQGGSGGAGGNGGAIYLEDSASTIVNCYFVGNRSGSGGNGGAGGKGGDQGTWAFGSAGNGGPGGDGGNGGLGGAIFAQYPSSPSIVTCTVTNNRLGFPGGPGTGGIGGAGLLPGSRGSDGSFGFLGSLGGAHVLGGMVVNSIFWGNDDYEVNATLVQWSCIEGGRSGTGNISSFPSLSGHKLLPQSPCIDAGKNSGVPAGVAKDIDGLPRFIDDVVASNVGNGSGPLVDMGASEFAQPYVLPYGCGNPAGSLAVGAGAPTTGTSIVLQVDYPRQPSSSGGSISPVLREAMAGVLVAMAPLGGCGTLLRGGYLQVDLTQPHSILLASQPWSGQPVDVSVSIPSDLSLVGTSLFVQGFVERPGVTRVPGMRLTDSLQLVIGP